VAWYDDPIGHGYITQYEGPNTDTPHYADDVETPFHTPITELFGGKVVTANYQPWGGQVFVETNVPGIGPIEEYFYHFDEIDVSPGQTVARGQKLGLSGGQTSGGEHPTNPHYSTGPHTHVGFFTKYVSAPGGGSIPYGPDITPYIHSGGAAGIPGSSDPCLGCGKQGSAAYNTCHAALAAKVGSVPACAQTGIAANQQQIAQATGVNFNLASDILGPLNTAFGVESTTDLAYRAGFILAGAVCILIGFLIFTKALSPSLTVG
jgi:murein DD-endopeptidase MepM/ murein hydrolase activator NlpD